jgi:hypothetical protein
MQYPETFEVWASNVVQGKHCAAKSSGGRPPTSRRIAVYRRALVESWRVRRAPTTSDFRSVAVDRPAKSTVRTVQLLCMQPEVRVCLTRSIRWKKFCYTCIQYWRLCRNVAARWHIVPDVRANVFRILWRRQRAHDVQFRWQPFVKIVQWHLEFRLRDV